MSTNPESFSVEHKTNSEGKPVIHILLAGKCIVSLLDIGGEYASLMINGSQVTTVITHDESRGNYWEESPRGIGIAIQALKSLESIKGCLQ